MNFGDKGFEVIELPLPAVESVLPVSEEFDRWEGSDLMRRGEFLRNSGVNFSDIK